MIPRLNWIKVGKSLRERGKAFQASAAKFDDSANLMVLYQVIKQCKPFDELLIQGL